MSEGRFDGYCRNIGKFAAWIGPEAAIDAIDEVKLEGYFNHLSLQIGAEKYSAGYAHTLMMTAKQFISRLAELRLIPLPGNIRPRRSASTIPPRKDRDIQHRRSAEIACLLRGLLRTDAAVICSCLTAACTRTTSPSCTATR